MGRNGPVRDKSESGRIWQDAEAWPRDDDVALVAACPELKCLVPLFSVDTLGAAARRARHLDIGADRVLIARGLIAEEVYLHRFSMRSGIRLLDLSAVPASSFALSDADIRSAARTGQLALRIDGKAVLVFSLRDDRARIFMQTALASPRQIGHLRLVTEQAFQDILIHRTRGIIRPAIDELRTRFPALSAAPPPRRWYAAAAWRTAVGALLLGCLAIATAFPAMAGDALALIFLAGIGIRLTASFLSATSPVTGHVPDHELPTYSIIVALYREERVVGQLLESLGALDYPPEKLDVILVLEADDDATHRTVADARPPPFVRVLVAPDEGPRTKPKALNVALPFARGRYVAIYDAEDRPDPDQLKRALAAFRAGHENLACVQARLAIENADDSLITRLFAAEYAAQFDIVMPGYDRLGLPWPLGGTSNHFDTAKLREAGAWDPFNVTEDADLGLRFARFRFRTGIIDSTTWEEAPIAMRPWIKQRTRWMKGWMRQSKIRITLAITTFWMDFSTPDHACCNAIAT